MDARTYLEEIRRLGDSIAEYEREIERLRTELESISGVSYDSISVMASVSGDTLTNKVARIMELEDQVSDAMIERAERRAQIIAQINKLPNRVQMTLLIKRYVDSLKFEQIALDMNYSYDRIIHIHKEALRSFEEMYADALETFEELCVV